MASQNINLDTQLLRELELARREHLDVLREIPLADRDAFAAACQQYEMRIEMILRSTIPPHGTDDSGNAIGGDDGEPPIPVPE